VSLREKITPRCKRGLQDENPDRQEPTLATSGYEGEGAVNRRYVAAGKGSTGTAPREKPCAGKPLPKKQVWKRRKSQGEGKGGRNLPTEISTKQPNTLRKRFKSIENRGGRGIHRRS